MARPRIHQPSYHYLLMHNRGLTAQEKRELKSLLLKEGLLVPNQSLTHEQYLRAEQYVQKYVLENKINIRPSRIPSYDKLNVPPHIQKELDLLDGTMTRMQELLSFKLRPDTCQTIISMVKGIMATSIIIGVESSHSSCDTQIRDHITEKYGTR